MRFLLAICLICAFTSANSATNPKKASDIARADSMLNTVLDLYNVEQYGLLLETYPQNQEQTISYLVEGSQPKLKQETSYLWPYSGIVSGCVSLYKTTSDPKYLELLKTRILPGLETYWDGKREPYCYQSYPMIFGNNDRYYDDNDWLAIDFCDLYELTKDQQYLDKAIALHKYIYSGWNEELGGGIFWCEQKRSSKNTCSNAPATVLCMKLFKHTNDKSYLELAKRTYEWTKKNLEDPTDNVYWDNIQLNGNIGKAKYTYNSGQMIQAGVLLYQQTGKKQYLVDAQNTAKGTHKYFCTKKSDATNIVFYRDMPWFNVILFRGLTALYEVDKDATYVNTMADNATYAWENTKDQNGLLEKDWTGIKKDKFKWLLDNACMVELYSEMSTIRK